jgi:hypothetical protein
MSKLIQRFKGVGDFTDTDIRILTPALAVTITGMYYCRITSTPRQQLL